MKNRYKLDMEFFNEGRLLAEFCVADFNALPKWTPETYGIKYKPLEQVDYRVLAADEKRGRVTIVQRFSGSEGTHFSKYEIDTGAADRAGIPIIGINKMLTLDHSGLPRWLNLNKVENRKDGAVGTKFTSFRFKRDYQPRIIEISAGGRLSNAFAALFDVAEDGALSLRQKYGILAKMLPTPVLKKMLETRVKTLAA